MIHHETDLERKQAAEIERLTKDAAILESVRGLLWDEHLECCGCPVVGAEYMGAKEMICCGNPGLSLLSDAQIMASLRSMLPAMKEQP